MAPERPAQDSDYLRKYRESLYGRRAYVNALAGRGYVVLAAGASYFGDRRLLKMGQGV